MDADIGARSPEPISQDAKGISEFHRDKFVAEAGRNWDLFYKTAIGLSASLRSCDRWEEPSIQRFAITAVVVSSAAGNIKITLALAGRIEIIGDWQHSAGCGVGNFFLPLLETNQELFIYACDFSPRAINLAKSDPKYTEERCKAFVCDLTKDPLTNDVPPSSVDLVSAVFVLSAIPPNKMMTAVQNIKSVLKPGGVVLLRDYGLHDAAQRRFKAGSKMGESFYVRHDGTFAYFFSTDDLEQLFVEAGFEVLSKEYVQKEIVNRKRELSMERIFVQARVRKL
ncbi:hypothetical protein HK104_000700 [Borealophlyctis nickersoniae]|nr:hypothetical protein HK104_000700 [Borealophlyctis nickersoniae]